MISGIDPEQNVLDAVNLISASADSGADLVVLPENFALMAGDAANLGIAEAVGEGPIQDAVRMAAMRCGLWVVAGSIPLKGKDATHYTQSSLVFDPEGNIAAPTTASISSACRTRPSSTTSASTSNPASPPSPSG